MSFSVNSNTTPLPNVRVRHGDECVDGDGTGVGDGLDGPDGARVRGAAGVGLTARTVDVVPLELV